MRNIRAKFTVFCILRLLRERQPASISSVPGPITRNNSDEDMFSQSLLFLVRDWQNHARFGLSAGREVVDNALEVLV